MSQYLTTETDIQNKFSTPNETPLQARIQNILTSGAKKKKKNVFNLFNLYNIYVW